MNIYHLKYFIDAARLGSISKSAAANYVSHSAISQGIKKLEEYFEVELMFHSKRLFQLTPQGEQCLTEGQRLLESLEDVRENLQLTAKEVTGELTISAPQSLIVDSLYKTLALYQKKYPKVEINLKPGSAAQVRSSFLNGETAIGILVDDGMIENFNSVLIKQGHFVFVSKNKNENLKEGSFIVTSKDKVEVNLLAKNYKSNYKKSLKYAMIVMSWGVIKNLALKGFGIGYVPDYCVAQEIQSGKLHQIQSTVPTFKYEIKAIWPRNKRIHQNAKLFIDLLKEMC